jgi:hypothetical protein
MAEAERKAYTIKRRANLTAKLEAMTHEEWIAACLAKEKRNRKRREERFIARSHPNLREWTRMMIETGGSKV